MSLVGVSVADYTLPDVPYDYGALEQLAEARAADQLGTVNLLEKNLAFNLGGHVNHSVPGGTSPTGPTSPAGSNAHGR
jgi:Fe-Mn family superoxide dismutase